jgi:hypothetical protein
MLAQSFAGRKLGQPVRLPPDPSGFPLRSVRALQQSLAYDGIVLFLLRRTTGAPFFKCCPNEIDSVAVR